MKKAAKIKPGDKELLKDISSFFNQMIGVGNGDYFVIKPKSAELSDALAKLSIIFETLANMPCWAKMYPDSGAKLVEFHKSFEESFNKYKMWPADLAPDDARLGEITKQYLALKTSPAVTSALGIYKSLHELEPAFAMTNYEVGLEYIFDNVGVAWRPLEFSDLNFRSVLDNPDISASTKELIFRIFAKLLFYATEVWKKISSPDADIDKFSETIIAALLTLKNRPELRGCDRAFNKIQRSVGMLREKMGDYYKDYIATGNRDIIVQNFVLDISQDSTNDPRLAAEMGRIITFYRKSMKTFEANGGLSETKQISDILGGLVGTASGAADGLLKRVDKALAKAAPGEGAEDPDSAEKADGATDSSDPYIAERKLNSEMSVDDLTKFIEK